jgi:isopenicillin N synthase-like dioxygenase
MKTIQKFFFGFCQIKPPTVDLTRYMNKAKGWEQDCKEVTEILHKYGLIYVKDNSVDYNQNEQFIDMMEQYFQLRSRQYEKGLSKLDVLQSDKYAGLEHSYTS